MNTKSPECFTTKPQARCLRIEISPGRSLLLPLDQFAFAELHSGDKEQVFHLSFATHEITVRGNALRRIETAMQELELSFLTTLPAKYHPVVGEGLPKIREIVVTENRPGDSQAQAALN
jgi:hypothetical protein